MSTLFQVNLRFRRMNLKTFTNYVAHYRNSPRTEMANDNKAADGTNAGNPVAIAVAVVRHAGRVLIGQRAPGVPLAGYWEFPGGKIVAGESPEAAAARECLEETGLAIRPEEILTVTEHAYPHGRVRLHFVAAEPLNPAQPPAAPFRWVALADLGHYHFPPANVEVVRALTTSGGGDFRLGVP